MADEPRSFDPDTTEANRTRQQGGGMGQREMDQQRDPNRDSEAPPAQPQQQQKRPDDRAEPKLAVSRQDGTRLEPRNGTGMGDTGGDLGAGTPANVDIHDIDQDDNPQAEWGQDTDGAAVHSASRGDRAPGKSQGPKTQARAKEINAGGQ
ncbi:MAG: hypothetical protein Q7V15_12035 [Phenylobacterium sp.]|uniref:hypothetical protein n=1 Tax=Phenylobacterium sp. TaxID=1871053 RepID=UPI00271F6BC1|nr:hypothetical protein [Phenylobacterium sp.]MDO8902073.1 hypothetical protein [Phenylobacterium sp.]